MLSTWISGHPGPFAIFVTLLLALAVDGLFGDPPRLYRRVPHPVVLVGRLIALGERRMNREADLPGRRLLLGAVLTVGVVLLVVIVGWLLTRLLAFPFGWIVEAVLVSTLIAFRGLADAARRVARALDESLEAGRKAVSELVGRDPDSLDEAGVARAAAESTAENFADGVVAPVFWFALLGLPGICAYKAVNTLDSMIGHRNERHDAFGKVAARLDDVVNWPAARLSALFIAAGAVFLGGANPLRALTTPWRDAGKHRSVNAGWPEAAMAGALGYALAGPRKYGDTVVEDAWMGDGEKELSADDLRRVLDLYVASCAVVVAAIAALALLL